MFNGLKLDLNPSKVEFKGFFLSPSDNLEYAVVLVPMKPEMAKEVKTNDKSRGKPAKE